MPLPKIAPPTYELELPSTGQTIQYRPFLVKEEKLLVLALEGEDVKEITTAIKNVIKSCIQTKGIKVDTLPTFDIEYLFLNIRGKSVGEELEVKLLCPDDDETYVPVKIPIDEIGVLKNDKHTNKIKFKVIFQTHIYHPYPKKLDNPSSTTSFSTFVLGFLTFTVWDSLGMVSKNFSMSLN